MSQQTSDRSADLFRLVLENVKEFAVFTTDLRGHILSWNPGVGRLLGYTEDEFRGQHGSVIFTPEDRESLVPEQEMQTALAEGSAEDRRWHLRKDGSRFWANGKLMLLRDAQGSPRGFAKIMLDDTERKRAEEELRRQTGLTDTIAGSLLEGIHVLDAEGRITFTNRAAQEMLGWTAAELVGKSQHETIHARDKDGRPHPVEECPVVGVLRTGVPVRDYETVYTRRDGTQFPVLCTSAPITAAGEARGVVMTFHDISARRRAEEKLRASEARFRELMRQSPLSTYVTDPEGRVLDVNPAFVDLWGLRLEDLAGYNARHDKQAEALGLKPYIERAYTGEAVEMPTVRYDPARTESIKEGQARWVRCFAYPIKDAAGQVREVVITHEDVSERMRTEAALRESEERYRVIAETASDAILTINQESTILTANPAVERVFGYAAQELIGEQLTVLM
ncbi:MAG TPA: PAS domain S-box protein, partial [Pyrinomonadaceae bacterium]